ncbi:MAG: AAA family ATPase [Sphingomonadaceae bacterium]
MILKAILDIWTEFYIDPLPVFLDKEKEPENYFSYKSFQVQNFRGLEDVSLDFTKNDLILLLGLNESGKTSILKAIEAFDFNNDPPPEFLKPFFTSMRNKQEVSSSTPCQITADIEFTEDLTYLTFRHVLKTAGFAGSVKAEVEEFFTRLNDKKKVRITRVVPFSGGNPGKSFYRFEDEQPLSDAKLERIIAQKIVSQCPFILYFEDFQDAIPTKIYTKKQNSAYNHSWYEIIDGLFYNTDSTLSIKSYEEFFNKNNLRENDARTVLKRVNKTLQKTFTEKWQDLSGVKDIDDAEIAYDPVKKYFEIKISDSDGTTFSVHERSKGAVWYLAFLMKTEFRRKKLREGSGKPVYLIDEPASNLHSTAQQKMVQDFVALVEDTTLVYTTHSRYLVSAGNVKNTYVVSRDKGVVRCVRWGDYIKGKSAKASYYQPLQDCLDVVPNNLDIPWARAIITEGPSDALTLEVMLRVLDIERTHAIYPGTSATALEGLISLNLGWRAEFSVLLDSDDAGTKAGKRYAKEFALADGTIIYVPGKNKETEDLFSSAEKVCLAKIALDIDVAKVSKKEFLATMRSLDNSLEVKIEDVRGCISDKTKKVFRDLIGQLTTH